MSTFRQFEPLIINDYVTDIYLYPPHGHTYYELIYIFKGKGIHLLNNNQMDYRSGDLFLMSPDDHHHFEVKQPTRFVVIKFTNEYFNNLTTIDVKAIMQMQTLKETKMAFNPQLSLSLKNTIQNISSYKEHKNVASLSHVYFQLLSVFGLIRDVIIRTNSLKKNAEKEQLITYIHQHIYDPQKCLIKNIARHFNISATYFGDYFKRSFDISYRDYVKEYRTSLIEKRIESGRLNMKQIAEEFGFSDESHFSNYFLKQRKLRPGAYKKKDYEQ